MHEAAVASHSSTAATTMGQREEHINLGAIAENLAIILE